MTHYIKQEPDGLWATMTYIYSTPVDVGAPQGFVHVRFINNEEAMDDNGRVYKVGHFKRYPYV